MIWHPVDSLYVLWGLLLFSSIHQAVFVPIFNTIHALRVWKVALRAWGLMCSLWSCGIWSRTKAWQCLLMEAWLLPSPSHLQPAWWPLPAMTSVSSFGNKTSNTDSQVRFCMFYIICPCLSGIVEVNLNLHGLYSGGMWWKQMWFPHPLCCYLIAVIEQLFATSSVLSFL